MFLHLSPISPHEVWFISAALTEQKERGQKNRKRDGDGARLSICIVQSLSLSALSEIAVGLYVMHLGEETLIAPSLLRLIRTTV